MGEIYNKYAEKAIVEWAKHIIAQCEKIIDDPSEMKDVRLTSTNMRRYKYVCVEFNDGTKIRGPYIEPKITYVDLCEDIMPGDACLVREKDCESWKAGVFVGVDKNKSLFITSGNRIWNQCIPYDGYEKYLCKSYSPLDK